VVVLDLKQLLAELEQRTGVGGRVADRLPADAAQIEILRSDELDLAQDAFTTLGALPIIAVGLSLALFGLALLLAPGWRRQATRGYGFGLVAAGAAALASGNFAGDAIVSSLVPTEAGVPAAREVWDISTELLVQAAGATIGYGLALILGVWLAGSTRPATAVRRVAAPYLREPAIAWLAFAAVAAIVVLWWAPTPATRNPATAALLVLLFGLGFEALRRKTAREFPEADRHELERRARERVVTAFHTLRERTAVAGAAVTRRAPAVGDGGNGTTAPDPRLDQIERLARLHDTGVLDDAEFRAEKARLLQPGSEPVGS
jgi:Short C-terminal domain